MASLIAAGINGYKYIFIEQQDPRVRNWLTMQSPIFPAVLIFLYHHFVRNFGPKYMQNRKPMNLETPMMIYNVLQILINSYFFYTGLSCLLSDELEYDGFLCCKIDFSNKPLALHVAFMTYLFYLSRCLDLVDTVLMVLRKKFSQISFLHMYHHAGMVAVGWIFTSYGAGGHVIFFGLINSFVHCVMYAYYLLAALKPEYKNSRWKRHLTQLQLAQFVFITLHGVITFVNPKCTFPKILIAPFIPQGIFMYILFWDFYKKAYNQKKNGGNKTDNHTKIESNEVKSDASLYKKYYKRNDATSH